MGASCSRVKQSDIAVPQQAWHTYVDKDCPIHGEAAMKRNHKHPTDNSPVIAAEEEEGQQSTTKCTSIATTTATSTNRHAFRAKYTHKVGGRKTDLQLFRPSTTTSFIPGEAVTFEVEVRNPAAKPFDPSHTHVIFMDNGYFKQTSVALAEQKEALALADAPGQAVTITMIVEPKRARMTLKDVKGECEVRLVSEGEEGGVAVFSQVFVFEAMDFAGGLTSSSSLSSPASTLNVYIMGGSQTGKTTFLETLRSVLLPAAAADEHTKQTPTPTKTLECIELHGLRARFFDLWGTSTTTAAATATHEGQLLACILRGEAPLGFSPSTHICEDERVTLQSTKTERSAHAVLFFVAADDVENNPTKMEALKATFEQIKASMGEGDAHTHTHPHTPLVVITRVDLVEPSIASDPAKVAQLRRRVSQYFGVSWSKTLVFVPYAAPHTHTHTHTHKHMGLVTATSSSRSLRSLMSKKSTSNVQQEGEKEGKGGSRSFDIDRLVLLIAKTALEAAREKLEGNHVVAGEEEAKKKKEGVGIIMNKEKMKRLATVELEMDGSFSSNFRGRIASPM